MNLRRLSALALAPLTLATPLLFAADERLPIGRTSNETVEISGNLLMGKDEIRQAIGPNVPGSDLGGGVIVVRVTVRPLSEKPVKLWLDDFTLISDKDGQRCAPFQPSQLAGSAAMVVKSAGGNGRVGTNSSIWGPLTGQSPGIGNANDQPTAVAEMKDDPGNKSSPLLAALREKSLPEKTIGEPVTGLLYFQIDGKVKPKNLELFYKTDGGKLGLRFTTEH